MNKKIIENKKENKISPMYILKKVFKSIKNENKELVKGKKLPPHIWVEDPRDKEKKLFIIYFKKNNFFKVYDNYNGKKGEEQEVWFFENGYTVVDFLNSEMEDESGCFESYVKKI